MTSTSSFDAPAVLAELEWLRDDARSDQAVLGHLAAENEATSAALECVSAVRNDLESALAEHLNIEKVTVRIPDGPYEYWTERPAGASYPRHLRRRLDSAAVEVLLDETAQAGDGYYHVASVEVSDDHELLAVAEDRTGDERYTITVTRLSDRTEVLRLESGDDTSWSSQVEFDSTGSYVLVARVDEMLRPFEVVAVSLADASTSSVFREPDLDPDEKFWVGFSTTSDYSTFCITAATKETSEVWLLDRADVTAAPRLVAPRTPRTYYTVDSYGPAGSASLLAVVDIDKQGNYLARPEGPDVAEWPVLLTPSGTVVIDSATPRADGHVVLDLRVDGFPRVGVLHHECPSAGLEVLPVDIPGAVSCSAVHLPDHASSEVWFEVYGYGVPDTVLSVPLCGERTSRNLHTRSMPASFDPEHYETGTFSVASHDGVLVPVSYLRRRGVTPIGVLLAGYGAYGISEEPVLALSWLAMADMGVVCVQAHVRGGGEFGSTWHAAGRMENKENSFHDLIAVAEESKSRFGVEGVVIHGGSAGGLLVGASLNMRPDLFAGVVAEVPFVDCLATMSDPTLPLTVEEYTEWGNPGEPEAFVRIRDYTPVLNVKAESYPPVLATCGLNDPRVSYWEPARWVQVLRAGSTSNAPFLLRTLDHGHFGSSGMASWASERAEIGAFIVGCLTGILSR